MQNIKKLWNEWEIQFLVLLSFTLQIFLFFTGSLRRRSTNMLLNFIIWIAYLGADLVAVYALGFLSRHEDTTTGSDTLRGVHQLAFFWAPFLLIHLGGQDTITAFAIEDNFLWLRHLLNLIVQVTLAIYVFWKSIDQYSHQLTASGIFVSVTGIIKYGERTMALMYGNLRNMGGALQKNKNTSGSNTNEHDGSHITENVEVVPRLEQADDVDYLGIVSFALQSAPGVRELFAGHTLHQMEDYQRSVLTSSRIRKAHMPKLLEVELDLMYDDLFTKAQVIRTKGGIVLRSLSQISMVVAFVLFLVSDHHGYSRADLAITYLLFSGAFFLEACAIFLLVMSPWTWSWLKARRCCGLAHVGTSLLSSCIRQSEGRTLWSNSMGQYNFLSYVGEKSRLSKLVKRVARMTAILVGANEGKKPLLWLSKLLDTEHVKVDKTTMESIIQTVYRSHRDHPISLVDAEWPNIGPFLKYLLPDFGASLGYGIVCFHIFTELYLQHTFIDDIGHLVTACRNVSNYMLYLVVTRPEMLPVSGTTGHTIKLFLDKIAHEDWHTSDRFTKLWRARDLLRRLGLSSEPPACRETLEEIMSVWTKLLVYSAGKSRAAVHATSLSTGGELITFAWLLMAHKQLGDVGQPYAFIIGDVGPVNPYIHEPVASKFEPTSPPPFTPSPLPPRANV
ncbi:uncharacterized protein [Miscanthus floridulus]|uniref:uncharacterized protein n=1 Tax=Miscanthus floridulus TaxID=154761 RepID=UPI003458DCE7